MPPLFSELLSGIPMKPDFTILRWAALFEGSSLLLLLFVAMPLKYYSGIPEVVRIIGPVHGVLFLGFLVLLFSHAAKRDLGIVKTLMGLVASFIPFGTFIFKAKVLKK
jgi:integral membrane protein